MSGSDIKLTVNERPVDAYLSLPAAGTGPGILVLHAWWGLKPFFKQLCDRLAELGFVAFAPDLNRGEIAHTVDEAKALMEKRDFPFTSNVARAANAYLLAHPALKGKSIGVMGFSMGAAWSMMIAAEAREKISAAVLFYGATDEDFSKVRAKILGHFAEVDEWEPMDGVRGMEEKMKAAGLDVTLFIYPEVSHWFLEDDRPEYNPTAANLACQRTFDFLKKELG
jgi:carboxymethylenebutenolidase